MTALYSTNTENIVSCSRLTINYQVHVHHYGRYPVRNWDVYPGSRILIFTHPGSRISDPGSRILSYRTFLFSLKCHKIEHYFSFEVLKKKIWANFHRIIELFTQRIVTKLSKIWVRDPGSGKNLSRIPDPGVKKASDPGSGSATLDTRLSLLCA
jgi:hypothetical protein